MGRLDIRVWLGQMRWDRGFAMGIRRCGTWRGSGFCGLDIFLVDLLVGWLVTLLDGEGFLCIRWAGCHLGLWLRDIRFYISLDGVHEVGILPYMIVSTFHMLLYITALISSCISHLKDPWHCTLSARSLSLPSPSCRLHARRVGREIM